MRGRAGSAGQGSDLDQVVGEYSVPAPDRRSMSAVQPGAVPHAVDGRDAEIASALSDLAAHGNAARLPKSIVVKH